MKHLTRCLGRAVWILLFLLTSGCFSFHDRWYDAHQQKFNGQSIAGIWAGPWQEGDEYSGFVKGVVARNDDGQWEAVVRVASEEAGFLEAKGDRTLYHWDFRVPLEVTPLPDGTFHIASQSRQYERLVGFFDLVIDGTADHDEISLGFSRGVRTGQMRLTRITPEPMVLLGVEPFLSIRYDSKDVRDQIRNAASLPLLSTELHNSQDDFVQASSEFAAE